MSKIVPVTGGKIVPVTGGDVAEFEPEKSAERISVLAAAIEHARKMEDWQAGQKAAKWMVREQKQFVAWWTATVGVRKSAGGQKLTVYNADQRSTLSVEKAEAKTKISQQQVSRWKKQLNRPGYEFRLMQPSHKKAMADGAQRRSDLQTGEMEWYTPAIYIDAARDVLGSIDLDPASSKEAQASIRAKKFYTLDDDGLSKDWNGTVWLNPPFASSLVKPFAAKLIESVKAGSVPAAIMITNAYTETSWFHSLATASAAVCFTRGRVKFDSPHGEKAAPTNGQSFFCFSDDVQQVRTFSERFAKFGLVIMRYA
jgi:phage N-6-adenine-methyltransferase